MTVDRDRYRVMTATAVLAVAAIAAVVSFDHIRALALSHGQSQITAWLTPISIDGVVVAASLVMLRAARSRMTTPWLARLMLAASVGATLAANIAYGARFGMTGALISGWPAASFIGCAEMAIGMVRRTSRRARAGDGLPPAAPALAPAPAATAKTPRREMRRATGPDLEASALEILARQPGIGGAELGRVLGASPRTGQRILSRLNGRVSSPQN